MDPRTDFAYAMEQRKRYNIRRLYFNRPGRGRIIARGLTLEEAQAHCSDPETSSSTCTRGAGRARTRRMGAWFDSYEDQR
jgi:hypothetical protein